MIGASFHRTRTLQAFVVVALVAGRAGVVVGEAPATNMVDAKALMQSGLKLYAANDYLGALAVFKDAYARFPSAKILLNIGTTLTRLDRKAEAANAYQRYLDSPDADLAKRADVVKALATLDQSVGTLELSITPGDSEVRIGEDDWQPASATKRYRVTPGAVTVEVRHPGFERSSRSLRTAAGAPLAIEIALAPPVVAGARSGGAAGAERATEIDDRDEDDDELHATARPYDWSWLGAMAVAHVDLSHRGGAGLVGVTADLTRRLQLQATAILGPAYGAYAGISFAILAGKLRPVVAAGVPVFASRGPRFAVRGAGGVELAVHRHLWLVAELGVEHLLNPEFDVEHTALIPSIGAKGRL